LCIVYLLLYPLLVNPPSSTIIVYLSMSGQTTHVRLVFEEAMLEREQHPCWLQEQHYDSLYIDEDENSEAA
jgi:hypothetical protein